MLRRVLGRLRAAQGMRALSTPGPREAVARVRQALGRFRKQELPLEDVVKRVLNPRFVAELPGQPIRERAVLGWQRIFRRLLPLGGASEGNHVTVFSEGADAFEAMWAAIEGAQESVRMESYIIEDDRIGLKTLGLLKAAAQRGVDVTVLYDCWGSMNLEFFQAQVMEELRQAGARVVPFNPIVTFPWRSHPFNRTHRKLLIVDDDVGFAGGMNIHEDYCGTRVGGTGKFRDTHLRVEGPAVVHLSQVFEDSLKEAEPERYGMAKLATPLTRLRNMATFKRLRPKVIEFLSARRIIPPQMAAASDADKSDETKSEASDRKEHEEKEAEEGGRVLAEGREAETKENFHPGGCFVQVLESNVWRNKRLIQKALRITLRYSTHTCYVTSPYFLPSQRIMQAMVRAAKKGVDVRVVTAGRTEVPMVWAGSQHVYEYLLANGVRIYEMNGKHLHAKTTVIDGMYTVIGTSNIDWFSWHRNLEVNLAILDGKISKDVQDQFFRDLELCEEVTLEGHQRRPLYVRFLHWLAFHLCRL